MATFNTEDKYIQKVIQEHPEYADMLEVLEDKKNRWIMRYGTPSIGIKHISDKDEDYELLQRVKPIEVDLLQRLKKLCDDNNIKMYLLYGTLLGAVRNDGLIPGDDDIDVALMRDDFNKLMSLADTLEEPYFLQTPYNDNCFYGGYLKLRRSDTTAIHPQNWWVDCNEGIGIDIFPLDCGYASIAKEARKKNRIKYLQRFLYAKEYGYFAAFKDMPLLVWKAYKYIGKLLDKKKLVDKLYKVMAEGDSVERNYVERNSSASVASVASSAVSATTADIHIPFGVYTHYMGEGNGRFTDKSAFDNTVIMTYEGVEMLAPANWDKVLSDFYGDDYLIPANLGLRKLRHGFYNVDVPYQNYKKRFRTTHRPGPAANQSIVLYGDKLMFDLYSKRYPGEDKKPTKVIEYKNNAVSDSTSSINESNDINDLAVLDKNNTYLIICGYDLRQLEENVREAGFRDYYFFTYNREWIQYANTSIIQEEVEKILEN